MLTEKVVNELDESYCDSDKSIHHIKDIKKIEETNKNYTGTVKLNGMKKESRIDTGSPITIMPMDNRIVKLTEIFFKKNEFVPRQ